jgi:N4-gp56 family major capsid protein
MLPTDELIKKAAGDATTSTLSALIPKVWAARIEKNLRKRQVLEQSILQFTDLLAPNAGDTLYVPILPDLGAAGSLTEGTDMSITSFSTASSVAYTPTEYGVTLEITRKALDRIKYDGAAEMIDRLSYSMLQTLESGVANLYNADVPGTSSAMSQLYPNGHNSTNVISTDTFSDSLMFAAIKTLLQANNSPFDDSYWMLFITPKQWSDLWQIDAVRRDIHYAAPGDILTGEIGRLYGCKLFVTNWLAQPVENGVTTSKALMVAPRWAGRAWKRRPGVVVDPTVYDMGRRRRFGIVADFDVELLHYERAVCITTA